MKILGLNVPPELALEWAKLMGVNLPKPDGTQVLRIKPTGATLKQAASNNLLNMDIDKAAAAAADLQQLDNTTGGREAFIYAEKQRLQNGIFAPEYWYECKVLSSDHYRSDNAPTPNNNPRPYAYRVPENLPTLTTYGTGVLDAAPSRSSGHTVAGYWQDDFWVWQRDIFELPDTRSKESLPMIFWSLSTSISATANMRGSRPMYSILMKSNIVAAASPLLTDLSAPRRPASSFYWRYVLPTAAAPYYAQSQSRKIAACLTRRAKFEAGADLSRCVLKFGVRPMLGSGFNNNTQVDTAFSGAVSSKLYLLRGLIGVVVGYCQNWQGGKAFVWKKATGIDYLTGSEPTDPNTAFCISHDGYTVAGFTRTGSYVQAYKWSSLGGLTLLGYLQDGGDSYSFGISGNGLVVTGWAYVSGHSHAFKWSIDTGMVDLGTYGNGLNSSGAAASLSGEFICGTCDAGDNARAFLWNQTTGIILLDKIQTGSFSNASGISGDGTVICGFQTNIPDQPPYSDLWHACKWSQNGAMQLLGELSSTTQSIAYGISADGLTICGICFTSYEIGSNYSTACYWAPDGVHGIGKLAGSLESFALGISADGKIITGYCNFGDHNKAFVWTKATGMIDLGTLPNTTNSYGYAVASL
jgi:probable HAF family extracellular repeat protein